MNIETFPLWDKVPGLCEETPTITAYIPDRGRKKGAVVVFPGGGYHHRAIHEGKGYAEFLAIHGFSAFVVEYRVSPHEFPLPVLDARRGVQFVRENAEKYGIDKDKIAVMGSSAGGHLAAFTSTYFEPIHFDGMPEIPKEDFMPNAQILCYPVIELGGEVGNSYTGEHLLGTRYDTEYEQLVPSLHISDKTPQAFIWHTFEDDDVDVRNSLGYAQTLKNYNIPFEMHIFPHGGHGKGRSVEDDPVSVHVHQWNDALINWLNYIGF